MSSYNAYQNGLLPHAGGTSEQPALFIPIMSTIGSQFSSETEYEQDRKKAAQEQVAAKQREAATVNGPPAYASLKGKK